MNSKFEGSYINYFIISILNTILCTITFGIATPWAICNLERWKINNSIVDGKRMYFDGTGSKLFGKFIIWYILILITLGFYSFIFFVKLQQWKVEHTHFVE